MLSFTFNFCFRNLF